MKEIRAIIRPNRLEKLRNVLRELPHFPGLTVFKAEGFTAPSAMQKRTDAEELTDYSPKLMVCVLADDDAAGKIQEIIANQCSTGQMGDGLVWTVDAGSVMRIRDSSFL